MEEREQVQGQEQEMPSAKMQEQDDSQYCWINVYDWQVSPRQSQETGESWYDIKLASNTFIEMNGEKLDVSHYHFSAPWEPAVTHGEPGTPRCTRGVHLPSDWSLTLRHYSNTAPEGQTPVFAETGRIQGVSPQQVADGVAERNSQWRAAHRKPSQEHEQGKEGQEQKHPGRDMCATRPRSAEPAL